MALLIQKLQEQANSTMATPAGWLTIEEMEKAEVKEQKDNLAEFEQSISRFLPLAAKRAQNLVTSLYERFKIKIPVSYLSIEDGTTFHVLMLVSQKDYLSPEMQAARLLTEKHYFREDKFDMHYTYTIGIENLSKNSMVSNSYKLKHITEFEKNLQVELVYLQAS